MIIVINPNVGQSGDLLPITAPKPQLISLIPEDSGFHVNLQEADEPKQAHVNATRAAHETNY
jgi:hypothetical protein